MPGFGGQQGDSLPGSPCPLFSGLGSRIIHPGELSDERRQATAAGRDSAPSTDLARVPVKTTQETQHNAGGPPISRCLPPHSRARSPRRSGAGRRRSWASMSPSSRRWRRGAVRWCWPPPPPGPGPRRRRRRSRGPACRLRCSTRQKGAPLAPISLGILAGVSAAAGFLFPILWMIALALAALAIATAGFAWRPGGERQQRARIRETGEALSAARDAAEPATPLLSRVLALRVAVASADLRRARNRGQSARRARRAGPGDPRRPARGQRGPGGEALRAGGGGGDPLRGRPGSRGRRRGSGGPDRGRRRRRRRDPAAGGGREAPGWLTRAEQRSWSWPDPSRAGWWWTRAATMGTWLRRSAPSASSAARVSYQRAGTSPWWWPTGCAPSAGWTSRWSPGWGQGRSCRS